MIGPSIEERIEVTRGMAETEVWRAWITLRLLAEVQTAGLDVQFAFWKDWNEMRDAILEPRQ